MVIICAQCVYVCIANNAYVCMRENISSIVLLSYFGAGILTYFPFGATIKKLYDAANDRHYTYTHITIHIIESVSDSALGLTHPRRTKLQHGTFLRFGHPRLIQYISQCNLSKTPCY